MCHVPIVIQGPPIVILDVIRNLVIKYPISNSPLPSYRHSGRDPESTPHSLANPERLRIYSNRSGLAREIYCRKGKNNLKC